MKFFKTLFNVFVVTQTGISASGKKQIGRAITSTVREAAPSCVLCLLRLATKPHGLILAAAGLSPLDVYLHR